jgi:hypothetical protein
MQAEKNKRGGKNFDDQKCDPKFHMFNFVEKK